MKFPPSPDDLPESAVKALAALCVGTEFGPLADGSLAVRVSPDRLYPVSGADLAALHERAHVVFGPEDPETGMPSSVDPTLVGRDYLRRWLAGNGVWALFTEEPSRG